MLTALARLGFLPCGVFLIFLLLSPSISLSQVAPGTSQITSGLNYDVYFIAGQSNAAGRGDAAELPNISGGIYDNPQTDVQLYFRSTLRSGGTINTTFPEDTFNDLRAGTGHGFNNPSSSPLAEFGPELSLGRTLADAFPTRNIAIVKYAHGGSDLASDWAANGVRYNEFVDVADKALEEIINAGATFDLQGLAWIQGEADVDTASAAAYEGNLTSLFQRFRTDVFSGDNEAQMVVSRLSDNQYTSLTAGVNTVRDAQVAVADNDLNVDWLDTDGPEFSTYNINTPIHFDAGGQISLGNAIGNAFVASSIPEPSSAVLIGALSLGFLASRRRS